MMAKEVSVYIAGGNVPSADRILHVAKSCDAINEIEILEAVDIIKFYQPEKEEVNDGEKAY